MKHRVLGSDSKYDKKCEGLAACWLGTSGGKRLPPASGHQASSCCTPRSQRESGWHLGAEGEMRYPTGTGATRRSQATARPRVNVDDTPCPHPRPAMSFKLQFHVFAPAWASAFSWLFKLNLSETKIVLCANSTPSNPIPDFPFPPGFRMPKLYMWFTVSIQPSEVCRASHRHVPLPFHSYCPPPSQCLCP